MAAKYLAIGSTKVVVQIVLNRLLPGSGCTVDFFQAARDLYNKDYMAAVLNIGSGLFCLITLGFGNEAKTIAKAAAKEASKNAAQKMAKEATSEIGKAASKEIAKGASKRAVVGQATMAAKKATKEIGRKFGKEIGKNMLENAVEQAAYTAAKDGMEEMVAKQAGMAFLDYTGAEAYYNVVLNLFSSYGEDLAKKIPNEAFKTTTAEAAKAAATEVCMDAEKAVLFMSIAKSALCGGLRDNPPD